MLTTNQLPRGSSNETSNISTGYGTPSEGPTHQLRGRSVIVENLNSAAIITAIMGLTLWSISSSAGVFVCNHNLKACNRLGVAAEVGLYTTALPLIYGIGRLIIGVCTTESQTTNTSDYQELA